MDDVVSWSWAVGMNTNNAVVCDDESASESMRMNL